MGTPTRRLSDDETQDFTDYRPLLFAIAYRMLGSVADAEDVLQEAFLRWQQSRGTGEEIQSPKAWLSTVVTRLCLDQLRSARRQREDYVGPWLPEPLLTDHEPDVADRAALSESLSMAFLVLLETLTPTERAVFLLHDVFAYDYAEVAAIVGHHPTSCRQLARRARARLAERRPRFAASPEQWDVLTTRFAEACADGDLTALISTLADDVTLWTDGGSRVRAARRPISGSERVGRFLIGILRGAPAELVSQPASVNGQPGIVTYLNGQPFGAVALEIDANRIRAVRIIVNPDKLRGVPPQDTVGLGADPPLT